MPAPRPLSDLREAEAGIAETLERRDCRASQSLNRTEIRAPRAGIVHQLAVHTIGGMIAPGADIMAIVPDLDELVIDAHVRPEDIDQVNRRPDGAGALPGLRPAHDARGRGRSRPGCRRPDAEPRRTRRPITPCAFALVPTRSSSSAPTSCAPACRPKPSSRPRSERPSAISCSRSPTRSPIPSERADKPEPRTQRPRSAVLHLVPRPVGDRVISLQRPLFARSWSRSARRGPASKRPFLGLAGSVVRYC